MTMILIFPFLHRNQRLALHLNLLAQVLSIQYQVTTMQVWNKKSVWSKPGEDRADVKNEANLSSKQCHRLQIAHLRSPSTRGGRYVLIIHFYVESGQKMIQFNIQFKIESKIFIQ